MKQTDTETTLNCKEQLKKLNNTFKMNNIKHFWNGTVGPPESCFSIKWTEILTKKCQAQLFETFEI